MPDFNRIHVFSTLREKHPTLIYESFSISRRNGGMEICFEFNLSGEITFRPKLFIPLADFNVNDVNEKVLENLAFHIGMVELISYWKAACPPKVIIRPFMLDEAQIDWWKQLWYFGLGEFFYTNGIEIGMDDFMDVSSSGEQYLEPFSFDSGSGVLVPVGGGKDSVVTLELLKNAGFDVVPFILNPRRASIQSAIQAGFDQQSIFTVKREIDPQLLILNQQGYLNGHTPFSALLGFTVLMAARLKGTGHIALSNESSANEPTIPGTHINHQYSKSVNFEKNFRAYTAKYISKDFNYFSFLRPLNELQIAGLFSRFPQHFESFRSCNVGSKTDEWCGKCPKCLFTRIILGPFMPADKLKGIFGRELLDDPELQRIFDELTGRASEKPFECVGTVDEVNAAVQQMLSENHDHDLPFLLRNYKTVQKSHNQSFNALMKTFNPHHFLQREFLEVLKRAIG